MLHFHHRQPDTAMSTSKKKPAAKAKPAKKSAARPIPPPPPGWEVVSQDDPRLKNLPCAPLLLDTVDNLPLWKHTVFAKGGKIADVHLTENSYALPIAEKPKTPKPAAEPAPPMIRLRLPSEKPTKEDADKHGEIGTYGPEGVNFCDWDGDISDVHFWFPGRLPEGLLPKPPTQEELWRKEFEECMAELYGMERRDGNPDVYSSHYTQAAWDGFLAAKKGGQP